MSKRTWRLAWLLFGVAVGCGSSGGELPTLGGPTGTSGANSCQKASQCAAEQGCVDGTCAPCVTGAHCMPGQFCSAGKCGPCTSNSQCPSGEACVNGACGGCTSNSQCVGGKICNLGQCGACTSNSQCASGQVCLDGKCACTSNDQCPGGQQCVSGVCSPDGVVQDAGGGDAGPPIVDSGRDAADACAGKAIYKTVFPNVPSVWDYNGKVGPAAGDEMCKTLLADHFCTYDEIRVAQARGELAALPNMTFWVHRTTPEVVNGVTNSGGAGARCNDWRYGTNDANNGEFGTITGGAIAYDLAPETKLVAGTSGSAGSARLCGPTATNKRNILCCAPKCP